jgi:magnesium transporter
MLNQIHTTESIVMLKLDSKRNYLLAVEVTLMLMSMLIAIPTFVVGAFGMNLTSSLEKAEFWFYIVVALCIVCPIVAYWFILAYFRRHGIQLSWKY